MKVWELLLYLVLIGIVLYLCYKLIYQLILSHQYNQTLDNIKIENKATSINDFFGGYPIYYINLDRSNDRRSYFAKMINKYDIKNITRIPAIDGKKISIDYKVHGYNKYTPSELACTLSHIKAIKAAYTNGDQIAVILEDDTGFGLLSKSKVNLSEIVNQAPDDWEYINLCPLNPFIYVLYSGTYVLNGKMNGLGTSAYVINRNGMEKVLKAIGNNVIDYKVCKSAHLFSDVLLPKLTKSYNYQGNLFYQNKTFPKEVEFSYTP